MSRPRAPIADAVVPSDLFPPEIQAQRLQKVIENELTPVMKDAVIAVYYQGKTIRQVAIERGCQPSTVSRALERAKRRIARCLRY